MSVIVQEEKTGCGIASVANIIGLPYADVKRKANSIGIFAEDDSLYSNTEYVRTLLNEYGFNSLGNETPFESWEKLPNLALLATKYYEENGRPYWHWVVFKRESSVMPVLDSASYLECNERTDFETINPKWYIAVSKI